MQEGLFVAETPRYDSSGVIDRINAIGKAVRENGGIVVFIQHDGPKGNLLEPGTDGWKLLSSLNRNSSDIVVNKTACDSFYKTDLAIVLETKKVKRLIVTGCATDFCVDTTVRAAFSLDYHIIVVADGHTTSDRPYVDAASLIQHHNWLWGGLINPNSKIEVLKAENLVARVSTVSDL
ncbi:MAG: isochorismatase family protein [Desulfobacteraceae bacterium]|jgi:nicotinamidase-related amidase